MGELIEHGHDVFVDDRQPPNEPFPVGVLVRPGTVEDAGAVRTFLRDGGADAVVHLARAGTNRDDLVVPITLPNSSSRRHAAPLTVNTASPSSPSNRLP